MNNIFSWRNLVVVGRVIDNSRLVGIKVIDLNSLEYKFVKREDFAFLFSNNNIVNCKYSGGNLHSTWHQLNIKMLRTYDVNGRIKRHGVFGESDIISRAVNIPTTYIAERICGALVSGAINDQDSIKALQHASMYYDEIRKMTHDVNVIAQKTGKSVEDIMKVKNYLFLQQHVIYGELRVFDPSFAIAQSWQRLLTPNMTPEPHDYLLIEHELAELNLVEKGMSQSDAHTKVSTIYDYSTASDIYYERRRNLNNDKNH